MMGQSKSLFRFATLDSLQCRSTTVCHSTLQALPVSIQPLTERAQSARKLWPLKFRMFVSSLGRVFIRFQCNSCKLQDPYRHRKPRPNQPWCASQRTFCNLTQAAQMQFLERAQAQFWNLSWLPRTLKRSRLHQWVMHAML